jgi:Bacterial regulatory proteins, luxR family
VPKNFAKLRLADVRRAFRLIGEIRQHGAEPQEWRPHLLRGLIDLLDADLVISSEVHFRTTAKSDVLTVTDIGWGQERGGEPWRIHSEREENPASYLVVVGKSSMPDDDMVPIKPAKKLRDGRGFILSQYALPHIGAVDQLGLHRYDLAKPFTHAQAKLVRLFHVELGRLWKEDALKRAADPTAELPPRLVQTLDGVLRGDSEKQIAFALGLSQHTVHNYIRALHSRFAVSSRAELIAKATEDRADFTPKLTINVRGRKAGVPNVPQAD